MPRHRHARTRSSYAIDSDSPQSNKDSDTVTTGTKTWRTRSRRKDRYASNSDDDEDDERIFTPLKRRLRHKSQNTDKTGKRRYTPAVARTINETVAHIRRSTRQRKLKYDNYNDSWIVGSQTVKGYPCYLSDSHGIPSERGSQSSRKPLIKIEENDGDGEEEDEEGEEEEPEQDDDDDDDDNELQTERKVSSKVGHSMVSRQMHKQMPLEASKHIPSEGDDQTDKVSNNGDEQRGGSNSSSSEETKSQDMFQDMYARVKQRRRACKRNECNETNEGDDEKRSRVTRRRSKLNVSQSNSAGKSDSEMSSEDFTEDGIVQRTARKRARSSRRTYHLRQVKPKVTRFQASEPLNGVVLGAIRRRRPSSRRARWSSSSSDSDSSERKYDRNKKKGKSSKSLALCGVSSAQSGNTKQSTTGLLADVDPVALDTSIRFSNIGGLESHINCLKEMVVFPMLYKEIFDKFCVTPPKGVLFHGPPGTGKTLMARALANECSQGSKKVSFFMRKGADCLSKWVGESERQLRILFEEAKQARPSIIFFDELDGLAPVRSSKQDQIHASIVCTLLALMDGLDNRGDIIVIGATNRIDSIDPALRRPGRFDRELYFPLPGFKERREILTIHTSGWGNETIVSKMAEESWGFCGSDLKSLCSEAVIQSLRRVFPQIYTSSQKLLLDPSKVTVEKEDFMKAKKVVVPAAKRSISFISKRLPGYLEPLLKRQLENCLEYISGIFPSYGLQSEKVSRNPRIVLIGDLQAVMPLSFAIMNKMENCSVLSLGLESIFGDSSVSPEETVCKVMSEARQRASSVIWLGEICLWWNALSELTRSVFISLMNSLDPTLPILFLAASSTSIPDQLRWMFSESHGEVKLIEPPSSSEKYNFYSSLLKNRTIKLPLIKKKPEDLEILSVAPPTPPRPLTEEESNKMYYEEETTLRELRIFLRQICAKLARNKQFYMFSKPVDINEVPDYLNIIHEPMDLETMMTKIDLHKYTCAEDFLKDIDLLCRNALEYNPDKDPEDKLIRHRACYLRDTAYALIKAEMDSDFEVMCKSIRDKRTKHGAEEGSSRFIREFFPDHPEEFISNTVSSNNVNTVLPNNSPLVQSSPLLNGDDHIGKSINHPDSETELTNSGRRKRKRRSMWSKGTWAKKKCGDEEKAVTMDVLNCHSSTPIKKSQCSESLVNGMSSSEPSADGLDESLALTELSVQSDQLEEKRLIVDEKGLKELLSKIVKFVENINSYSILIDLYVILSRIVESYSRKWDRKNLTQDLNSRFSSFVEEVSVSRSLHLE